MFLDGSDRLLLVRAWLDDEQDLEDETSALTELARLSLNAQASIGVLEITCGVLAILWAPESGACIETLDVVGSMRPTGEMAIDGTGLLVGLPNGRYECVSDEVDGPVGSARRCHLRLAAVDADT